MRWRRRPGSRSGVALTPSTRSRAHWAATAACCAWTTPRRCSPTSPRWSSGCWRPRPVSTCWPPAGSGWASRTSTCTSWPRCPCRPARTGQPRGPAVRRPGTGPGGGALTDDDVEVVAAICRRLDGLPLAIELGAARAPVFGLREFAERLGQGLDLLAGGRRTAAGPAPTVRAVVDWSYGLLTDDEALLFARLAVFPSAFAVDQVEAVCAEPPLARSAVAPLLARLSEQSLVQSGRAGSGCSRPCAPTRGSGSRRRTGWSCAPGTRLDVAERLTELSRQILTPREAEAVAAIAAMSPDLHAAWDLRGRARPAAGGPAGGRRARLRLPAAAARPPRLGAHGGGVGHRLTAGLPDALACAAAASWARGDLPQAAELAARGVAAAGGPEARRPRGR